MMWDYGYGYGQPMMWGGGDVFGAIFSIIWIIVLIVAIVAAVRYLRGKHPMHLHGGNRALDLLKERYAKGEIARAEFEEKKKDLS